MRSFLRKRGYILLYLLLLCTFFTSLPPVSLSSSAPPQPPHGHMYVLCLSTSPSSHYPTLRPVPPTFRSALTQVLYLSHNNSTHWDLQSIPITFPLGVISCKLSHPSLLSSDPLVDHYNHYNHSHVLFLSICLGKFQILIYLLPSPKQLLVYGKKKPQPCYISFYMGTQISLKSFYISLDKALCYSSVWLFLPFSPSLNLQPSLIPPHIQLGISFLIVITNKE